MKFSSNFPDEKEKFLRGNLQIWFVTRDSVTYQCGVKEWQPLYGTFLRDLAEDALVTWLWCDSPRQRNNFNPRFFLLHFNFQMFKKGKFKMKIRMKKLESCLTEATVILWRIATFKIHWDIIRVNFLSRNHKFMWWNI